MFIRDLDVRYWMKKFNARKVNSNSVKHWYVDINDDVFIEIDFGTAKRTFSIEFLGRKSGLFSYTHDLPTCFLESFIELAKSFVSEKGPDFHDLANSNEHFRDYITRKTGLKFTYC